MEHTDAEVARVLSALQGRFAGHSIHQHSRPSSPSRGAGGGLGGGEAKVWVIPAGVGSDLARPATLAALVEQWGQLDEPQKINALLGVAHVGQSKMQRVRGSVERLGELARADGSSDWVRALGHTLGGVGATGKMAALEELPEGSAVRAELDAAVGRLHAAALARQPELRLAAGVLPCVGARVAAATAPPAIRHVYGAPPSARRHFARGADAALEGLFGDSGSDGDSDAAEQESEPPAARLALRVRSSHRADHAGRMARLLAAAAEPPPASAAIGGAAAGPRRPSLGVARGSASAAAAAAAAGGPGAGGAAAAAGGGASKIGMFAPRRRAAPTNAALPGSGLGSVPAARRGSEKKIMLTDSLDTEVMNARDTLLQERRERAIEEREAKRVKRQAEVDERKRKRVEAAEKKKAAAEGRRSPPAKRGRPPRGAASRAKSRDGSADDDDASGNDDGDGDGEGGGEDNATSPPSRSARASPSPAPSAQPIAYVPPLEYRTYAGNDATTRAIYADTNALTDQGRMQLYCFFNAYPRPPDTPQEVSVVLNERIVDDSSTSGKVRREITALSVDFASGKWEKKRLYRRIQ